MELIKHIQTHGERDFDHLVLVLHGMSGGEHSVQPIVRTVQSELGKCRILVPILPFRWSDSFDMRDLAREVLDMLLKEETSRYKRITIIGHSAGGVLAQTVYILCEREEKGAQMLPNLRLVLMAPISKGWSISHHLPIREKMVWVTALSLLPVIQMLLWVRSRVASRCSTIPWSLQIRRSSPFLIWMRLQWLKLKHEPHTSLPQVVQILGSIDELISWDDMVDPGIGDNFVYFEAAYSNHSDVMDFDDETHGAARRDRLQIALGDFEKAKAHQDSITPWDSDPAPVQENVRRVVFVIHGIRDEGHWTQKIASRSRRVYAEQPGCERRDIAVITRRYGFFSMLDFLRYRKRRAKTKWLVEQYCEARRRYPNAKFSYLGHSHGTYLVAHALEVYPDVHFDRIAFAGSVVSAAFDWSKYIPNRVGYLLNCTSQSDWVVGIFPRVADYLPWSRWLLGPSLGGAGVEKFRVESARIQNIGYRKGAHSSAIEESNWNNLARFCVENEETLGFPMEVSKADKSRYEEQVLYPFRRGVGVVTSLVGWVCVLGLLGGFFPWLAYTYPVPFYSIPIKLLLCLVITLLFVDVLSQRRMHKSRKEIGGLGTALIFFIVVLFVAWSLYQFVPDSLWVQLNGLTNEGMRSAAVGVYFFVLYSGLSRI